MFSVPSKIVEYNLLFLILSSFDLQSPSLVVVGVETTGCCQLLPLLFRMFEDRFEGDLGLS